MDLDLDLDREPQTMAYAAAEELQALNHATLKPEAFYGENGAVSAAPANASATVSGLSALFERLPQSVDQVSAALRHLEELQAIRMADSSDPSEATSRALRALINAKQAVQMAHAHLREAAGVMSNMGGHFDDELEDTGSAV